MALIVSLYFEEGDLKKPSRDMDLEDIDNLLFEAENLGDYVATYESREMPWDKGDEDG